MLQQQTPLAAVAVAAVAVAAVAAVACIAAYIDTPCVRCLLSLRLGVSCCLFL